MISIRFFSPSVFLDLRFIVNNICMSVLNKLAFKILKRFSINNFTFTKTIKIHTKFVYHTRHLTAEKRIATNNGGKNNQRPTRYDNIQDIS